MILAKNPFAHLFRLFVVSSLLWTSVVRGKIEKVPNVLILFVDDMGYGDLSCQGNTTVKSPRIDELASEGVRFTQWISADSICTPSRGALLTGRLPVRLGLSSGVYYERVLQPLSPGGLPHSEHTLAEALKERGYNTHLTGKWHLGIGKDGEFLPTTHGFDHFYGMGITNVQSCMPGKTIYTDHTLYEFIWRNTYHIWLGAAVASFLAFVFGHISYKSFFYSLILLMIVFLVVVKGVEYMTLMSPRMCLLHHDREIIQQPINLNNLTQKYTENARSFISKSVDEKKPFFLYMSYAKLHTALFSNPEFKKNSPNEKEFPQYQYTNNILELDWSVGAIVDHLKDLNVFEDTIIWLSSDNGPFLERGVEGGSKSFYAEEDGQLVLKKLRGGKAQIWEGGFRVPGIAVYKPMFPANTVSNEPVSTMDIFPTSLNIIDEFSKPDFTESLTYTKERPHNIIDGKDLTEMLTTLGSDKPHKSPHEEMIHYCGDELSAVRLDGRFKAYFSTPVFTEENDETCRVQSSCQCQGNFVVQHDPPLLFDLDADIEEQKPLVPSNFTAYDDIMERVRKAVEVHKSSIEQFPNHPSEVKKLQRPWLLPTVCCDFPNCACDKHVDPALAV